MRGDSPLQGNGLSATHDGSDGPAGGSDKAHWDLDRLTRHIRQIESLQAEMITAELDRLNELTTLTRIADSLSRRRDFDEVLDDCLDEVTRIVGNDGVWLVEATGDGPIGRIHHLGGTDRCNILPRGVRSLCQRIYANRPCQNLVLSEGDGDCFGAPIFTGKHLVGTLVVDDPGLTIARDENKVRLIQSVLRQTAMAAENDRLIKVLNHMIVEVVCAFSLAIESRDAYTGGHVQRVTAYAVLLAEKLGFDSRQKSILRLGGLLHDIGKVAIPDAILNKPGKLTDEEFNLIKTHPVVGHQIVAQIPQLHFVDDVIRHHHERWDGRGYPDRLAGQNIPMLARVLAIADTFDAMTSSRSYRWAMSHEQAMTEIRQCAGTQFDAELAASFAHFTRDELDRAYGDTRQWCQNADHRSGQSLIDLIDLNMPAMR